MGKRQACQNVSSNSTICVAMYGDCEWCLNRKGIFEDVVVAANTGEGCVRATRGLCVGASVSSL